MPSHMGWLLGWGAQRVGPGFEEVTMNGEWGAEVAEEGELLSIPNPCSTPTCRMDI